MIYVTSLWRLLTLHYENMKYHGYINYMNDKRNAFTVKIYMDTYNVTLQAPPYTLI